MPGTQNLIFGLGALFTHAFSSLDASITAFQVSRMLVFEEITHHTYYISYRAHGFYFFLSALLDDVVPTTNSQPGVVLPGNMSSGYTILS